MNTETKTSVQIISNADYKANLLNRAKLGIASQQGTLMFPSELWDCLSYCDEKAIKKAFKITKKIKAILITTDAHPDFSWELNRQIPYRNGVCCSSRVPESYRDERWGAYFTKFPTGNAYIVV